MTENFLLLKWGTIKAYDVTGNQEAFKLVQKFFTGKPHCAPMLIQPDEEQKELLCQIIDSIDGTISNDWSGKVYTKEEAKQYVRTYI